MHKGTKEQSILDHEENLRWVIICLFNFNFNFNFLNWVAICAFCRSQDLPLSPRSRQSAGQLLAHLGRMDGARGLEQPWDGAAWTRCPPSPAASTPPCSLRGPLFVTSVTRATNLAHGRGTEN